MLGWTFSLTADESDLRLLTEVTGAGFEVVRQGDLYLLTSPAIPPAEGAHTAFEKANELVIVLSGLLLLTDSQAGRVEISDVEFVRSDGGRDRYLFPAPARATARTFAPTITTGGRDERPTNDREQTPLSELAATLLDSASAQRALRFLLTGTWESLAKALEVVEHEVGGEKSLERLSWVSNRELKRLTQTANSMQAVGDEARHAKPHFEAPRVPMAIDEAKALVKDLILCWLRDTRSSPPS